MLALVAQQILMPGGRNVNSRARRCTKDWIIKLKLSQGGERLHCLTSERVKYSFSQHLL